MGQSSTRWPAKVPVLKAGDFCRLAFQSGERCCMVGWIHKVFNNYHAVRKVERTLSGFISKKPGSEYFNRDIMAFNDDGRTKLSTLASVWNKTMASLGYTRD